MTDFTIQAEKAAIGLYAVGAYDFMDFIDMVNECSNKITIDTLYKMLSTDNPEQSKSNKELNKRLLPIVENKMERM
jgi:hypothetical protein